MDELTWLNKKEILHLNSKFNKILSGVQNAKILCIYVYIYSLPSFIKDLKGCHIDLIGIVYIRSQIKYNVSIFLNKTLLG